MQAGGDKCSLQVRGSRFLVHAAAYDGSDLRLRQMMCVCIEKGSVNHVKTGFLRNWVISRTSPGVATKNASYGQVKSFERSMLLYRFYGILRASRSESTGGRRKG